MIQIIDLKNNNIGSWVFFLEELGLDFCISDKIPNKDHIKAFLIPGVGSFPSAMSNLLKKDIFKYLSQCNTPIIGICLGMQLLCMKSYENNNETNGLGLINCECIRLPNQKYHIGWNNLINNHDNKKNSEVYFNHGYYLNLKNKNQIQEYSLFNNIKIPSVILTKKVLGFQFHPEKSQEEGQKIFKKYLDKLCH